MFKMLIKSKTTVSLLGKVLITSADLTYVVLSFVHLIVPS